MSSNAQASQTNLFYARLENMLNPEHQLYKLALQIDWDLFDIQFADYPKQAAWPIAPIRMLTSLVMLKQIYHLQDEWVLKRWEENPYFQFFSGETQFQWRAPLPISDLIHFQQWISEEHLQEIRAQLRPLLNRKKKLGGNLTLGF